MEELYSRLNCTFTETEKETCTPIMIRMAEIVENVHADGLFYVKDILGSEPNSFLKTGLQLAVNVANPKRVKETLQLMILRDRPTGVTLLSKLIITQGIICATNGENLHQMALRLGTMLGEKYIGFAEAVYKEYKLAIPKLKPDEKQLTQEEIDQLVERITSEMKKRSNNFDT